MNIIDYIMFVICMASLAYYLWKFLSLCERVDRLERELLDAPQSQKEPHATQDQR